MRKHKAHIAGGGFHNNGGNGFALSAEHFFQCGFIIKRNGNGVGGNVLGTPGLSGTPSVAAPLPALTSRLS